MNIFSFLGQTAVPSSSVLLGDFGKLLVWASALSFVLAAVAWLAVPRQEMLSKVARWAFVSGCGLLFATIGLLANLFATNRFEFEYVWGHGDKRNTLPYQIAGVWAGQEGSFLLWACCAALFGLFAVGKTQIYQRWFGFAYASFLATICGILAYESPFRMNPAVPEDGVGLSPALQNYWMTIHPPVIFLGFGALTVPAALALAALLVRNYNDWVPIVRPWAILSMTLTALGLAMGGFWAYETLGWGGFWMWDPVENTSFVPWVLAAALCHGLIMQATKKKWVASNLLMAGLPFVAFVYGTFLTRSGLLSETSVHSFAQMNNVALKLLVGFFGISTLFFLGLWLWRTIQIARESPETPLEKGFNREGFYPLGVYLLITIGIATAIGMSIPMIMSVMGRPQKVVEEALYHRVLTWLFVPLMVVMAAGPLASWRGMGASALGKRVYGVICATTVLVGLTMVGLARSGWTAPPDERIPLTFGLQVPTMPWILVLVALCYFAVVANVWRMVELRRGAKLGMGGFVAHIGVAVLMLGLIVSRGLERKDQAVVQEGGHNMVLGHFVAYKGMTKDVMDRENKIIFEFKSKAKSFTARPGFYYSKSQDGMLNPMSWPHIERHPLYDTYVTLHPRQTEAGEPVAIKPGASAEVGGFKVRYVKSTHSGANHEQGQFGALLEVASGHGSTTVNPTIEMHDHGIHQNDAPLGEDFLFSLKSLDATTKEATVQVLYAKPIYPIEVFFKPMTILVWLGTAIIAFAGLMSAIYRWPRKKVAPERPDPEVPEAPEALQQEERELAGIR